MWAVAALNLKGYDVRFVQIRYALNNSRLVADDAKILARPTCLPEVVAQDMTVPDMTLKRDTLHQPTSCLIQPSRRVSVEPILCFVDAWGTSADHLMP
jgi:hypothetical protein